MRATEKRGGLEQDALEIGVDPVEWEQLQDRYRAARWCDPDDDWEWR